MTFGEQMKEKVEVTSYREDKELAMDREEWTLNRQEYGS